MAPENKSPMRRGSNRSSAKSPSKSVKSSFSDQFSPSIFKKAPEKKPKLLPKSRQFRGYVQPPVNERLVQIKNFLADEDPNRKLGFGEKLAEIDEYIKYIEDENIDRDAGLFRDVKSMSEVHHDWDQRVKDGPPDTTCCDAPSINPVSARLISREEADRLKEQKIASGVQSQMREDHPPFTVDRQADEDEFLQALTQSAQEVTALIDESTNLTWVEGRAYEWALREPALIPYWMHDTKGLPKSGVKPGDSDPWCRKHGGGQPLFNQQVRPPMQNLPDYLEAVQNKINSLITLGSRRTEQEQAELEDYMESLEPKSLQKLHKLYKAKAAAYLERQTTWTENTPDDERDFYRTEFQSAQTSYRRKARHWRRKFGPEGVQFMVEDPTKKNQKAPGVFYFPDESTLDPDVKEGVDAMNASILRDTFQYGWKSIPLGLKMTALVLLWKAGVLSEKSREIYFLATEDGSQQVLHQKAIEQFSRDMNEISRKYQAIRILRPGELIPPTKTEGVLRIKFIPSDEYLESGRVLLEKQEHLDDETNMPVDTDVAIDWKPKAQRRGIRRAAIELGLNLLCANHEQHRPKDKFRILELPSRYISKDLPEVSLTIPLEPHKRPVEMDTFEYTKEVAAYHHDTDLAYSEARKRVMSYDAIELPPPENYRGPFEVGTAETMLKLFQKKLNTMYEIYRSLAYISEVYPRPIINRMLARVEEGLHLQPGEQNEFMIMRPDENGKELEVVDLSQAEIELFDELTEPSWDELRRPYDLAQLPGWRSRQLQELQEFDQAVDELGNQIPLWDSVKAKRVLKNKIELFEQAAHDPKVRSKKAMSVSKLMQILNGPRLERGELLWTETRVIAFLNAMKAHDVIHFDNDEPQQVSRIPYTGHPENRYVISRAAAPNSPGVYQNTDGHYVVRYDEDGTVGILTVQPNKWYHFQQIAFRLGRYISQLLTWSAEYKAVYLDHAQTQYDQHKECDDLITLAIGDENSQSGCAEISAPNIRHLAYDLHAVAPDLAEEAGLVFQSKDYDDTAEGQAIVREAEETGLPPRAPVEMTTRQAAKLLNMQVTQELNNNWESRFPENERIWDFAAHRIAAQPQKSDDGNTVFAKPAVQKFFSMRRFPVCCQSEETQERIRNSGVVLQEKSKAATQEDIEAQYESGMSRREERPGEIYRGGKMEPMFPFGETPYQENFLSWQMEQALKDVPRFQSPRPSRWTMPTFTLPRFKLVTLSPKPPPNPFDLPALPKSFDPVSQTEEEKRFEDIEARREEARKDRAQNPNSKAPNPDILENFYSQAEVGDMIEREEYMEKLRGAARFREPVERHVEERYDEVTVEDEEMAMQELSVDPEKLASSLSPRLSRDADALASPRVTDSDGGRGVKRMAEGPPMDEVSPKRVAFGGREYRSVSAESIDESEDSFG